MPVDIFSTHVFDPCDRKLTSSEFLSFWIHFSAQNKPKKSEEIHFDIDKSKTAFDTVCFTPLVAGQVVDDEGYVTKSFKPAYAKDKRRFDPLRPS